MVGIVGEAMDAHQHLIFKGGWADVAPSRRRVSVFHMQFQFVLVFKYFQAYDTLIILFAVGVWGNADCRVGIG